MEDLQLSEQERRYFHDLFLLCCNGESVISVPIVKACEFFRKTELSNDIIRQITVSCSWNQSSDILLIGEFYIALKMIAAAQAGVPLAYAINNPFVYPRFSWPSYEQSDLIQLSDHAAAAATALWSAGGKNSPSASSTASDSPTPTNSVQDKAWVDNNVRQGMVCEEQRQLLGTEEESSDRHSSSEETEPESIWTITDEMRTSGNNQSISSETHEPKKKLNLSV